MRSFQVLVTVALMFCAASTQAQNNGRIEGTVTQNSGKSIGGVTVVLSELGLVEVTRSGGQFAFSGIPVGSYNLTYSLGEDTTSKSVDVTAGDTTSADLSVDWDVTFADTITVFSASRRRERLVDAPAAVTVITEEQIDREAAHGQLPKLLEHTPGAETTQSGLYDFNFNSRGFNSSLNRRVLALVDGRDPSNIFLGAQEWSSLTIPLDSLASVELIRGPGAALYGADAFNGVINMTTRQPRDSQGGHLRLSGGELATARLDLTYSAALGNEWFGRFVGGYAESDDFGQARQDLNGNGTLDVPSEAEYPGLNIEAAPLARDTNEAKWASVRFDKYSTGGGKSLSFEAGYSDFEAGGLTVTGIGRVQTTKSERPYVRFNFNSKHWNFLAYRNERDAPNTISMGTGVPLFLDSDKSLAEIQANVDFAAGRGRLIGGATYSEENFDSTNTQGNQTLVFEKVTEDFQGVFGQIEYSFSDKVKGVVSARWDDASTHDSQVSPRAAMVFSATPNHTLRAHYGEAFQSPNYPELYLHVPVAAPLRAFAGLESLFCTPFGAQCGLGAIPVEALGNPDLEIEEVKSFEVGYSGVLGHKAFLTIDYYNSQLENFITDLISAFNPQLGLLNPAFAPYSAPATIPEPFRSLLESTLRGLVPTLTNNPINGLALLKAVTYTNFGDVDTQGVELGLNVRVNPAWTLDFTYNWFDFDVKNQLAADPLQPNSPENQYGFGVSYQADAFDISTKFRHVDGFDWAAGVFSGPIPAYDLVDLTAAYQINEQVEVGVNVSNLFDENHYQIFGGDLLERRALAQVSFHW